MINKIIMPLKGYKKSPLYDKKGVLNRKNNFIWAKADADNKKLAKIDQKIERVYPNGSRLVTRIFEEPGGRNTGRFFVAKSGKFWRSLRLGENYLEIATGRIKNGVEHVEKFFKKENGKIQEIKSFSKQQTMLNTLK